MVFKLPIGNVNILTRLFLNVMAISILVLAYIIYKNEAVYWYSGVSFEETLKADSERRKKYALAHVSTFAKFAFAMFLVSSLMQLFALSIMWDICFCVVGMIYSAVSTIKIRL